MSPIKRLRYEKQNPINWKTDKCVICRMSLKVELTNYKTPDGEISLGDFVIRFEHKFLINIYTNEQIKESYHIKDLESYYEIFEECIAICVGLLALLNNFKRNDFINSAVEKFVEDKFLGSVAQTEIKKCTIINIWQGTEI